MSTSLYEHFKIGDINKINELIEKHGNKIYEEGIRTCAKYGHFELVKLFHSKGGNINIYEEEAFRWAVIKNDYDMVKYFIDNNVNIHVKNEFALSHSSLNGG